MVLFASGEKIRRYIAEQCRQKKLRQSFHVSPSGSMYYVLGVADGSASTVFRIADHPQKIRSMRSLIVGRSTRFATVKRFIDRRIALLESKTSRQMFAAFLRAPS